MIARANDLTDSLEVEFRLDSVRTGAWVTVLASIPALAYAATGGGRSDRAAFFAAWIVGLLSGLVALKLPWRSIIRSRWREAAFLAWTLADLVLITVAVVSDGGPNSPIRAFYFIPLAFVGTSYPTRSVNLVIAFSVAGYTALALGYGQSVGSALIVLTGLGGVALISWWQARNHERRRRSLARVSLTDALTNTLNRRGLEAAVAAGFGAFDRFGTCFSLLIMDLDDFKEYNDEFGHLAGDELLIGTAEAVRRTLRPTDSLARIGGDEFAVVAAGADSKAARALAERIRAECLGWRGCSVGIATSPGDGLDYDSLYRTADDALYREKRRHHGRHSGNHEPAPPIREEDVRAHLGEVRCESPLQQPRHDFAHGASASLRPHDL